VLLLVYNQNEILREKESVILRGFKDIMRNFDIGGQTKVALKAALYCGFFYVLK
jgi:hypothetical protein